MIAIDLRKQQVFDSDSKVMQQINFTENLVRNSVSNTTMFFIADEGKEVILDFSQGTMKVLWIYF